jgi:catechol 2,3-dioxygenase-like lactoylglutathione lyase family enzyme
MQATQGVGIEKLGTVTVYVRDQDVARTFYTEALGFAVRADMPMAPGNNWLTVAPAGSATEIMLFHDDERAGTSHMMAFHTSKIDDTHQHMAAHGVHFIEPPTPQFWGGIQAMFTDPDGNVFILIQLPESWNAAR